MEQYLLLLIQTIMLHTHNFNLLEFHFINLLQTRSHNIAALLTRAPVLVCWSWNKLDLAHHCYIAFDIFIAFVKYHLSSEGSYSLFIYIFIYIYIHLYITLLLSFSNLVIFELQCLECFLVSSSLQSCYLNLRFFICCYFKFLYRFCYNN